MALVLRDRVKETTTTAGTGTITLAGAVSGFQSFAAIGNGNSTYYVITDPATGDWEVGVGTYTSSGTTLSRTTVLSSSNAGSLVPFGAGAKDVFVSYPSSRSVYQNEAGTATVQHEFVTVNAGTANITTANITAGTVSTTPASANDLVNKTYVDTLVASGIHFHQPVRVESPINLNATYNNGTSGVGATLTNAGTQTALVIDGVTVSVNDRVLVYQQTNQTQNGIYTVTNVGSGSTNWVLTRATDANTYVINSANGLSEGSTVFVQEGATGAGETYTCNTAGVITFGTTNITFAQISSAQIYSAGTGLTLSGTQFSITNTGVSATTYGSASAVPVFAVNAQGQITSVTNTNIAISGSAVSGNITGLSGGTTAALTAGTYLTSAGTFNGSTARTFAVDATSANTADKVVARDSSGNFSAGTITATLSGAATSATTATNLAGGAANRLAVQSGAGATTFVVAPTTSGQVLSWNGSAFAYVAGTISGVSLGSNLNSLTAGTYLTGTAYNGSGAQTWAVDATTTNTASKVVARDASGNFSAGTITAALSGNATTATTATQVSNNLTLATSGTGLSGSATFNGSSAQTFTVTSNATSANTVSTIVARDSSGNFSAGTITATLSGNATNVSGTVAVANGGTGSTSLTANNVLLGNGTSALQVVAPGASGNVLTSNGTTWTSAAGLSLSGDNTWTGTQTFTGTSSKLAVVLNDAAETTTVTATAATGTINFDVTTQSVLYYTSNASGNWTLNVRASSGTSLNTIMSTGQSVTIAFIVTNGGTAYYQTGFQVDGSSVTPRWQGGTAPTAGNASSLDVYVITIIKTGAATFTALASQTKFA